MLRPQACSRRHSTACSFGNRVHELMLMWNNVRKAIGICFGFLFGFGFGYGLTQIWTYEVWIFSPYWDNKSMDNPNQSLGNPLYSYSLILIGNSKISFAGRILVIFLRFHVYSSLKTCFISETP
jgi:hypothetical protein